MRRTRQNVLGTLAAAGLAVLAPAKAVALGNYALSCSDAEHSWTLYESRTARIHKAEVRLKSPGSFQLTTGSAGFPFEAWVFSAPGDGQSFALKAQSKPRQRHWSTTLTIRAAQGETVLVKIVRQDPGCTRCLATVTIRPLRCG